MDAKILLKEHISKIVELTEQQFDYFYSHFKTETFKKWAE